MNNLMAANLFRAKKTPLVWGSLVLCFAFGAYMSFHQWNEHRLFGFVTNLDSIFFGYTFSAALVSAVFIPLFFGTEYSDGILRNRVTTGSRRQDIYLANFVSSFLFILLTCAAYLAGCILVGLPLLGWLKLAPGLILCFLGGSVLLMAAWCAIFTLITMNCRQKSAAIIICMLCLLVLFAAALMVEGRLEEPEMSTGYYLSIDGVLQPEPVCLNAALEEALAAAYPLLTEKGIEPKIEMPEEKVLRQLDRQALGRIFGNLLQNAARHGGGDLRIVLGLDGSVTFSNTAPGLGRVQVERLFGRYFSVGAAKDAPSGLGLPIAKALAEKMGGKLTAEYESGGREKPGRLRIRAEFPS